VLKRVLFVFFAAGVAGAWGVLVGGAPLAWSKVTLFTVYADEDDAFSRHFVPSGWMGDYADVALTTGHRGDPRSGKTCIKIVYSRNPRPRQGWAGVVWQHPENNWGDREGAGIDLSATSRLTFWARGERGGERIEEFKVGGAKGPYPDSDEAKIGPVVLTQAWQKYVIDLSGKDLTHIISGFVWSTNLTGNPAGCTFYLDDIRFE